MGSNQSTTFPGLFGPQPSMLPMNSIGQMNGNTTNQTAQTENGNLGVNGVVGVDTSNQQFGLSLPQQNTSAQNNTGNNFGLTSPGAFNNNSNSNQNPLNFGTNNQGANTGNNFGLTSPGAFNNNSNSNQNPLNFGTNNQGANTGNNFGLTSPGAFNNASSASLDGVSLAQSNPNQEFFGLFNNELPNGQALIRFGQPTSQNDGFGVLPPTFPPSQPQVNVSPQVPQVNGPSQIEVQPNNSQPPTIQLPQQQTINPPQQQTPPVTYEPGSYPTPQQMQQQVPYDYPVPPKPGYPTYYPPSSIPRPSDYYPKNQQQQQPMVNPAWQYQQPDTNANSGYPRKDNYGVPSPDEFNTPNQPASTQSGQKKNDAAVLDLSSLAPEYQEGLERWGGYIREAAEKYDLDPALLASLVAQESTFKENAKSDAGAIGPAQLMPATAAELGVKDIFDPKQNIEGGAKYLRQQLDANDGDVRLALMAYNWGPGNVARYKAGKIKEEDVAEETRKYVPEVLERMRQFEDAGFTS